MILFCDAKLQYKRATCKESDANRLLNNLNGAFAAATLLQCAVRNGVDDNGICPMDFYGACRLPEAAEFARDGIFS